MRELRQRVVEAWAECQHGVIDDAIDQWENDGKRLSTHNVVAFNTSCNAACMNVSRLFSKPSTLGRTMTDQMNELCSSQG